MALVWYARSWGSIVLYWSCWCYKVVSVLTHGFPFFTHDNRWEQDNKTMQTYQAFYMIRECCSDILELIMNTCIEDLSYSHSLSHDKWLLVQQKACSQCVLRTVIKINDVVKEAQLGLGHESLCQQYLHHCLCGMKLQIVSIGSDAEDNCIKEDVHWSKKMPPFEISLLKQAECH